MAAVSTTVPEPVSTTAPEPVEGTPSRWRRALRFANGVLGADKYERYLAWHRTTAQPGEAMDRKEFWRHEYHRQEHNPGSRCC
ncbi:uncharacterized protein DUF466 [Luteococcus japonicus]|uniref:Uncharacterized protein n=2 Tax=Luteococcus japonicus TaxID=33984 RepID=A0A1R4KES8_9ACTN|nr:MULTISPECIES: YbdD/YjiX family protein [Luteococcus]MDN5562498.1 YbdD/YjiX family protein [Luteococcus sp.]ROR54159.1 uncharacterized protein DUF466 [Luteococcus japonicus]SJN42787.1 hypothetical protein FM114_13755 [Luteococcus japonicus LSP_Lj1]